MQHDCVLRVAGRGRLTSFSVGYKTGGIGTSGSEICHLHEDQTQDALDRPVVEKTTISDESRFNLSSDDNRVRVWRPHGERLIPAFAVPFLPAVGATHRSHSWCDGVGCHCLQYTVTPSIVRWHHDSQWVSQDCLRTVTTLSWSARSPDLSPIEHIWDYLGWQVGHPTTTGGLLATGLVILNHGQVTRKTPELVPPSPNFHTPQWEGRLSFDMFDVHRPLHGRSSVVLSSNS
ncbi:transposable element Tcb2 transposase [Trichonephila clavipes]|nr:transposable element Tcb2 transposase [Trichonephila clavipes]